jgi:hypothetical protein
LSLPEISETREREEKMSSITRKLLVLLWLLGSACWGAQTSPQVSKDLSSCTYDHPITWGETLSGIALQELGAGRLYPLLAKANGDIKPPYLIYAGRILKIPCQLAKKKSAIRSEKSIARREKKSSTKSVVAKTITTETLPIDQVSEEPATKVTPAKTDAIAVETITMETAAILRKIAETENQIEATRLRIEETKRQIEKVDAETRETEAEAKRLKDEATRLVSSTRGSPPAIP